MIGDATQIDLLDPGTFSRGVPHPLFDGLRGAGVTRAHSRSVGVDFWVVARHEDVETVSRNVTIFSSAARGTILGYPPEQLQEVATLTHTDAPRHRFLRRLVQGWFTPRAVSMLEESIRRTFRLALDRARARGSCDFVADVAEGVPAEAVGVILGVPPADRSSIARWGRLINAGEDPSFARALAEERPWEALSAYCHRLAAGRRRTPADDLTSHLLHARIDGQRVDVREFESMFALVVNAGTGTTLDAMSCGLLALLEHPHQARRLQDEPGLIPAAVEEVLRWSTPILYFSRTAVEDTELAGQGIRAGEQLAMYFAGANFDPLVFEEPYRFLVDRAPNPHVTFGGPGPHLCLGAHLARLELRVMLEELVPYLANLELTGEPERLRSHINNGFKRMPVRIDRGA